MFINLRKNDESFYLKNVQIKASRNPCNNHNPTLTVWKKKTLLQLFLYFSVQIETENYNLIYESQFRHFIKWGKICITFGAFYDQLWASASRGHKIFQFFFDFSLLEWRVVKNSARDFWLRFYFLRYWPTLHITFRYWK